MTPIINFEQHHKLQSLIISMLATRHFHGQTVS
jgi:hypothetical protein